MYAVKNPVTLTKKESSVKKLKVLHSTVAQATLSCALYQKEGRNIKSQDDISKFRKKLVAALLAHLSTVAVDVLPPYEAFLYLHRKKWGKPNIVAYRQSVVANQEIGYEMLGDAAAIRGGVMRPTVLQPTTLKELIVQYWNTNAISFEVLLAYMQQPEPHQVGENAEEDGGEGDGGVGGGAMIDVIVQ